jgi:hypothetical protein
MSGRGLLLFSFLVFTQSPAHLVGQAAHPPPEIAQPLLSGKEVLAAGLILAATLVSDQGLRGGSHGPGICCCDSPRRRD